MILRIGFKNGARAFDVTDTAASTLLKTFQGFVLQNSTRPVTCVDLAYKENIGRSYYAREITINLNHVCWVEAVKDDVT